MKDTLKERLEGIQKSPLLVYLLLPATGVIVNTLFNFLNRVLGLPFFFDSMATAVVSALFGIIPGLITGILSQLSMEILLVHYFNQPFGEAFAFFLCQFATAGVVAALVRFGMFRTLPGLLVGILGVTFGNALVGAFVATFVFGGITLHGSDFLIAGLMMGGQSLMEAAFWGRIPLNLIDKGIAVSLAYLAYKTMVKPVPRSLKD